MQRQKIVSVDLLCDLSESKPGLYTVELTEATSPSQCVKTKWRIVKEQDFKRDREGAECACEFHRKPICGN